jgi:dihydroflavonol-4-reductase
MRILVTGSTGLLGNNIVRAALERGFDVSVLIRDKQKPPALADLPVEIFHGDITDAQAVLDASKSINAIIHSAAHLHIGWKKLAEATAVNEGGTKNIVQAASSVGAKLVHVSTVNTLAIGNREGTVDETASRVGQVPCTYVTTKKLAERVVDQAIEDGLPATVIHPGFMLGPWDWKRSSGRMVLEVGKRFTPLAPSGGCSVCDVRDVADGILNAAQGACTGEHYILAGENMSYFELWTKISKAMGKQPPITIMRWPARWLAGSLGDLWANLTGNESDINSAALAMSCQFHCYSSAKAIRDLNYRIRSADESIQSTIDWFNASASTQAS